MNKDKFEMQRAALVLTYRCNLKCKLCGAYAPYYDNPLHFSYDYFKKAIDKYFNIVDFVGKFVITGGEPLLHNDLPQVLQYLKKYNEKIGIIEIFTNGTIIPSAELIQSIIMNKEKINFLVDDYGVVSKNIEKIDSVLKKSQIIYKIRKYHGNDAHCGGWVDYIDLSKKHEDKYSIEEKFSKCAYPQKMDFCFIIKKDGEMHPCSPSYRCMELGYITKNKEEYIDLFDESISVENQRQKIKAILGRKSLAACAFCNGLCEDSERFTPAEQL